MALAVGADDLIESLFGHELCLGELAPGAAFLGAHEEELGAHGVDPPVEGLPGRCRRFGTILDPGHE